MRTYDWIVIGGGITGSALAYELLKQGFSVLLQEKDAAPNNATLYSYGGLAYWSGTTPLTRQLCKEGIEIHRNLSEELGSDTEFRELDLLLTIEAEKEPQELAKNYARFDISPRLLSVKEALELEPLLDPDAISGALRLPHAHVHPQKTTRAYQAAFRDRGGDIVIDAAVELLRQGSRILGVKTTRQTYHAANTVVCAGAWSRILLKEAGIALQHYFTHAQLIRIPPVDFKLQTLVMPALQKRFLLEAKASSLEFESLWERSDCQPPTPILDPGAVQFLDRSLYLGQISQILPHPEAEIDPRSGEAEIRQGVGNVLPILKNLPGTWHRCLVSFSGNSIALVGKLENFAGIYIFSGFTSTLVYAPPLARHFASWVATEEDEIIPHLSRSIRA